MTGTATEDKDSCEVVQPEGRVRGPYSRVSSTEGAFKKKFIMASDVRWIITQFKLVHGEYASDVVNDSVRVYVRLSKVVPLSELRRFGEGGDIRILTEALRKNDFEKHPKNARLDTSETCGTSEGGSHSKSPERASKEVD